MITMREHSRTFRFVTEVPERRPEGVLIENARASMSPKLSGRAAADAAGISEGRWRQIINGYLSAGGGNYVPVIAPPDTLARMAHVVGVTPDQLVEVDRGDAASELHRLTKAREEGRSQPVGTGVQPVDLTNLSPDEIEAVKAVIRAMRSGRSDT